MLGLRTDRLVRAIVRMAPPVFLGVVLLWIGAPPLVKAIAPPPMPVSDGGGRDDIAVSKLVFPEKTTVGMSAGSSQDLAMSAGDDRFGINFVNSVDVNASLPSSTVALRYQQATEAGARWTRWPMYWSDIETSPGVRNYAAQDAVVDRDLANGLQPHVILLFSPSWAATSGDPAAPFPRVGDRTFSPMLTPSGVRLSTAIAPPKNLYLAWNDSNNYWGQFVYNTVRRYSSKVKVWEMWNEPDYSIFWSGTVADYYQLLKVGYQAAKAADSQATVLFGGLSFWSNQDFFPQVLDRATIDGRADFFDALPWHPYIDPYYVYSWAQRAREQMQTKLGLIKPVWVNETNIPVCGEWATSCGSGDTWRATPDEQASYVVQAYSYALAADVRRLSIFQLWDDGLAQPPPPNEPEYYGMVTNGGATRPSLRAYQVAATYLSQPATVTQAAGSGYEKIVAEGTPQGRVTVVWATGGNDVQVLVPAASNAARLVDQSGAVSIVTPSGGYYRLSLPRATNNRDPDPGRFIVGGKPYLLVESSVSLTGRVTDNRGIGLVGARVAAGQLATTADANGNFSMTVPPGTYGVIASFDGYGTIPARSMEITRALSYGFVLPAANNRVQNWGFEGAGGVGWVTSGQVSTSGSWMHSGANSVALGAAGVAGDAAISQSGITIPEGTYRPTVSFLYAVPQSGDSGDTFFLDVTSSTGTTSYSLPLATQGTWAHKWFALDHLSGQITLNFRLYKASANQVRVFLDEVSVGKASGGPNVLYFPQAWKG